jgi:hypothetical protein
VSSARGFLEQHGGVGDQDHELLAVHPPTAAAAHSWQEKAVNGELAVWDWVSRRYECCAPPWLIERSRAGRTAIGEAEST